MTTMCFRPDTTFKYEIGQIAFRFGDRVKIVARHASAMGKVPTYDVEMYYMGNRQTVNVWQDELSAKP